ncbi:unnamed protein product, partial [Closterium sp. NIES-65]
MRQVPAPEQDRAARRRVDLRREELRPILLLEGTLAVTSFCLFVRACYGKRLTQREFQDEKEEKTLFTFDRTFYQDSSQQEVFSYVALPVVQDALSAINGTVLAYGQGPNMLIDDPESSGILPRVAKEIFVRINADLYDVSKDNLVVKEDQTRGISIAGVTEAAIKNRAVGATNKASHIPYRDSKLTRILQESLGGNSRTTLLCCCSPSTYNYAESVSTVRFGLRAKQIKNKPVANREGSQMLAACIEGLHGLLSSEGMGWASELPTIEDMSDIPKLLPAVVEKHLSSQSSEGNDEKDLNAVETYRMARFSLIYAAMFTLAVAVTVTLPLCECAEPSQSVAITPASNAARATYRSEIFQADVSIVVDEKSILFQASPPPNFKDLFAYTNPAYESFPLPPGSPKTVFNHVGLIYNPFGALPFLAGQEDPTPVNGTHAVNETCLSCFLFITFFHVDPSLVNTTGAGCAFNDNGFCSVTKGTPIFQPPSKDLLGGSFATSSGTMYKSRPLLSPFGSKLLAKSVLTPLAAPRVGMIWTSSVQPPALFGYDGKATLGPTNYYATSDSQVMGIGQAVSTTYIDLYAGYFTANPETLNTPVTTSVFDRPAKYGVSGLYPGAAYSQVTGYRGMSTFTFGFTNFTQ